MLPLLLAGAALLRGLGSLNQSNAEQAQWKGRERAQRFNAAVLRSQAATTSDAYSAREDQQRRAARLALGASDAWLGASGTGTGGSNADVSAQNAVMAELDALNVRYEGQLRRHDLLMEAAGQDIGAESSHTQANYVSKGKALGFVGAMLGPLSAGLGYGFGGGSGGVTIGDPGGQTQIGDYGAS